MHSQCLPNAPSNIYIAKKYNNNLGIMIDYYICHSLHIQKAFKYYIRTFLPPSSCQCMSDSPFPILRQCFLDHHPNYFILKNKINFSNHRSKIII